LQEIVQFVLSIWAGSSVNAWRTFQSQADGRTVEKRLHNFDYRWLILPPSIPSTISHFFHINSLRSTSNLPWPACYPICHQISISPFNSIISHPRNPVWSFSLPLPSLCLHKHSVEIMISKNFIASDNKKDFLNPPAVSRNPFTGAIFTIVEISNLFDYSSQRG
jgi:hypothetical protein